MFLAQLYKNNSKNIVPNLLPSIFAHKNLQTRVDTKGKTIIKSYTWAVHELGDLLHLKTE